MDFRIKAQILSLCVYVILVSTTHALSRCVSGCGSHGNGDYQSCNGCGVYVTCSNGIIYDNRPCPGGLVWNDHGKYCDWSSPTCPEGGSMPAPTTTTRPPTTTNRLPTTTTRPPPTTTRPPKGGSTKTNSFPSKGGSKTTTATGRAIHKGCWKDSPDHVLKPAFDRFTFNTPQLCINNCVQKGYSIAGVERLGCFCGDSLIEGAEKIDQRFCNTRCNGNKGRKCGGHLAIDIYNIVG